MFIPTLLSNAIVCNRNVFFSIKDRMDGYKSTDTTIFGRQTRINWRRLVTGQGRSRSSPMRAKWRMGFFGAFRLNIYKKGVEATFFVLKTYFCTSSWILMIFSVYAITLCLLTQWRDSSLFGSVLEKSEKSCSAHWMRASVILSIYVDIWCQRKERCWPWQWSHICRDGHGHLTTSHQRLTV